MSARVIWRPSKPQDCRPVFKPAGRMKTGLQTRARSRRAVIGVPKMGMMGVVPLPEDGVSGATSPLWGPCFAIQVQACNLPLVNFIAAVGLGCASSIWRASCASSYRRSACCESYA